MRILGIDPGTAIVGYAVVDYENGKYKPLDYGCIFTDKDEDMPVRLEMAIEDLFFFKNQKTVIKVGQARGVITLAGQKNKLNLYSYTPLQVKMGIASYGRADKKQIQEMVKLMLKLDEIPKPDDAADALAIAITHINSKIGFGGFDRGDNITKKLSKITSNRIKLEDYKKLMK